jgi:hypothetical protein
MGIEVWGEMNKSQTDAELIEAAISRLIQAHDDDPTAHMEDDQSIGLHRINDVLDHPAGSVPTDKFSFARTIKTWFESIDGWTNYSAGTGSALAQLGGLFLSTGGTSGGVGALAILGSVFIGLNMSKAFYWRTTIFSDISNIISYFGPCYAVDLVDFNGFGFRIVSGSLQAFMGDYTNLATITISGIDITETHIYEIRYSVVPQKAEFYIDGNLVATFDSGNFPENGDEFCTLLLKNTTSSTHNCAVSDFQYEQER